MAGSLCFRHAGDTTLVRERINNHSDDWVFGLGWFKIERCQLGQPWIGCISGSHGCLRYQPDNESLRFTDSDMEPLQGLVGGTWQHMNLKG